MNTEKQGENSAAVHTGISGTSNMEEEIRQNENDQLLMKNMDCKFEFDMFKHQNEKYLKDKINNEWLLEKIQDLYTECGVLIETKTNFISQCHAEMQSIKEQNYLTVRNKIVKERRQLEKRVETCRTHFKQLKIALNDCGTNTISFQTMNQQSKEKIECFKKEDEEKKMKLRREINKIQKIFEAENEHFSSDLAEKQSMVDTQIEILEKILQRNIELGTCYDKLIENESVSISEREIVMKQKDSLLEDLNEKQELYQSMIEEFSREKSEKLSLIRQLKDEELLQKEKIEELQAQRNMLQANFDNQNKLTEDIQEKFNNLENTYSELEECLETKANDLQEIKYRLLQKQVQYNNQDVKERTRIEVLQINFNQLKEQHCLLNKNLNEMGKLNENLNTEYKKDLDDLEKVTINIENAKQDLSENDLIYANKFTDLTNKTRELDLKCEGLTNMNRILNKNLRDLNQKFDAVLYKKQTTLDTFKQIEARNRQRNDSIQEEMNRLKEVLDKFNDNINNLNIEMEEHSKNTNLKREHNEKSRKECEDSIENVLSEVAIKRERMLKEKNRMEEKIKKSESHYNELVLTKEKTDKQLGDVLHEFQMKSGLNISDNISEISSPAKVIMIADSSDSVSENDDHSPDDDDVQMSSKRKYNYASEPVIGDYLTGEETDVEDSQPSRIPNLSSNRKSKITKKRLMQTD